jgi:hypothetical protein
VIYLRHAFAASGLQVPSTVDVVVDDVEWLVAQVGAEMEALFPDARVTVNGAAVATDLLVVVYPGGTRPEDRLTGVSSRAREARVGVALYCVDDRRFDLVGASDLVRWERDQRRRRRVLGLSLRLPRVWNRVVRRLVAP